MHTVNPAESFSATGMLAPRAVDIQNKVDVGIRRKEQMPIRLMQACGESG